jgi:hypothetical protein
MAGMKNRPKALLQGCAIAVCLAAGVFRQHPPLGHGVELLFVSLAVLYLGLLHRHWAAFRGRAAPAGRGLFALELLAFTGLAVYPVARWTHVVAGLATLAAALPPIGTPDEGSERATWLDELWPVTTLLAGAAVAGILSSLPEVTALLGLVALSLALEAVVRAPRTVDAAVRRSAAAGVLGALAVLDRYQGARSEAAQAVLLVVAAVVAAVGLASVALRFGARATPEEERLRRRRALFRIVAVGLALALVWVGGELVFRIASLGGDVTLGQPEESVWHVPGGHYVYYGPVLGKREEPGITGNAFTWNKQGYHDVDHETAKPPATVRVAVLGDSYIDAVQLPLEKIYPRLLESKLAAATPPPARVEVLAFGSSGWGQVQELAALEKDALPYRPDLVVLEFLPGNDVRNNLPELEDYANGLNRTAARRVQVAAIDNGLKFTAFIAEKLHPLVLRLSGAPLEIDSDVFRPKPIYRDAKLWEAAWARTDELIGEIAATTAAARARLVVVNFPGQMEVNATWEPQTIATDMDARLPARRMTEICRRRGIPCLDLAPRFGARDTPARADVCLKSDGHWSAVGHLWGAEETTRFLAEETQLWHEVLGSAR